MSFTDSTTIAYKTLSGTVSQFGTDEPGSLRQTPTVTVPASTSNYHVALSTVDVGRLVSFLIYSNQELTLKTNSPTSPIQTFTLKANQGMTWNSASGLGNPIVSDLSDLYFTNVGSVAAIVQMSFLQS